MVQIANSINSGDINYKRIATIKKLDYVYWSSPVGGFNINNLNTLLPSGPKYKWQPTIANTNGGIGGWTCHTVFAFSTNDIWFEGNIH